MTQQVAERSSTDCNREVVTKCEVSIKKTGVQRVQRTVREVYLREDIPCGIRNCSRCTEFINDADEDSLTSHIGLPLNLRVQEGEGMPAPSKGPVSPKLADQVQNNSTVAGTDMTTVNHRVDGGRCVLLLVSTKKRKVQAAQHGVPVMLVSEFVEDRRLHGYAGCGELLSEFLEDSDDAQDDAVDADHRPAKRARTTSSSTPEAARRRRVPVYPAHLKESEVNAGIHSQRLYQGTLRMPPSTSMVGFVKCPNPAAQGSGMEYIEYRISGRPHLNRAFHGDVVVIEPLNHFSAVPVPTTVLPVPTTVLPVPTTVLPVPTTVLPVPTTVLPVPTTVLPVPTTVL
eukprot:Lankesteria_metandrocarpae@DN1890_c0_g1_i2.p1